LLIQRRTIKPNNMKQIVIYRLIFSDDGTTYYFKGIEDLREFGISRIEDGWETEMTIDDLQDDGNLVHFITKDYGEKLDVLMVITEDDFKTIKN